MEYNAFYTYIYTNTSTIGIYAHAHRLSRARARTPALVSSSVGLKSRAENQCGVRACRNAIKNTRIILSRIFYSVVLEYSDEPLWCMQLAAN